MISIVYHTYLVGDWKNLIKKQLDRIKVSGLYDVADEIWVTINLSGNNEQDVRKYFLEYSKINLEFNEQNHAEYPGIKKVKELCEKYDTKIFYFHTKGVSNNWITFNDKQPSLKKIENVSSWRECMEHFLIDNWKDCVEKLNTYDNVGVSCNGGWYWGNFWWSQSKHIKKTSDVGIWGRWDYEAWLNKDTPNSTNYEFYHMGYNPFLSNIPLEFYTGGLEKYKNNNIVVKKAFYGTPPFEIDEGYSTTPLNVGIDVTEKVNMLLNLTENKHLKFNVNNNTMGEDPIWGHRKCMIIEFYPEGYENKIIELGVTEGHEIDFKF